MIYEEEKTVLQPAPVLQQVVYVWLNFSADNAYFLKLRVEVNGSRERVS